MALFSESVELDLILNSNPNMKSIAFFSDCDVKTNYVNKQTNKQKNSEAVYVL